MALFNVKDFGAVGNGIADDTVAIRVAVKYALANQAGLRFPAGQYIVSDGTHAGASGAGVPDNQSQQALLITGAGTSFNLSVVFGTSGTVQSFGATGIPYGSNTTTNANSISSALSPLGSVTCVYDPVSNWYIVTFPTSLGAPVMTASGTGLSITITVLQSGAAVVIANAFALQLVGDGSALSDFDQASSPSPFSPASRSAIVWKGIPNGIMLHLMGCNSTLVQDLALWGRTGTDTATARTGLLLSPNLLNVASKQGGTGLTCKTCVLTHFKTPLPEGGSVFGTPSVSGCIQLGMNENDTACDATSYEACTFANGGVGLLVVAQYSVNHYMHSCAIQSLRAGIWFQQGGNFQCDGLKAEAVTSEDTTEFPPAVLKIGPGGESSYGYYGGGVNASTFILNNIRTNPVTMSGPNIPVVDARYAAVGTQINVNGWDDTSATPLENTPAFIVGGGCSLNVRHSLTNRPVLAVEGSGNPPTATTPATLRLENLIVPEHTLAAALCQSLTANTKMDLVGERTSQYNVVRPDVSTVIGRPRYSPVNWLIEQQTPKYFYDLGDIGLVAPNQGWNLYISATPPRTDGQYVPPFTQNVQGLVATDGIGGFDTKNTGYVNLRNTFMSLGQVSGQSWTLFVIARRVASSGDQPILSNLGSLGGGGLELKFDTNGKIVFTSDNGSPTRYSVTSVTSTASGALTYILIQIIPNSSLKVYLNGGSSADNTSSLTGVTATYMDNSIVPVIGATPGTPPTPSNLQIARLATFDLAVPISAWTAIFNAGTMFQGR